MCGGADAKILYLDKCVFLLTPENVNLLQKQVFTLKDGKPTPNATMFEDSQFHLCTSNSLFVLQEKCVYAHDDKSVRPFLFVETAGPYLNESDFKRIWLAFVNVDGIECIHSEELFFKFPPSKASWLTATESFMFAMSSPLTQSKDENGKIVFT